MEPTHDLTTRLRSILRYDVPASIVVFLVALPLSLGIAIASGAPVAAGLIAGVIGGIVAGALGGSVVQVSGPAAGLTVVVAESINRFGFAATCFIVAAAGLLQIAFGLSRVARSALAVAPVVVHAMLAGIGITIALQQAHVLLGGTSHSGAWENLTALPGQVMSLHGASAVLGLLVIAVMFGWKYMPAKVRAVPAALAAILLATIVSLVAPVDVARVQIDGSLFDSLGLPEIPSGSWGAIALTIVTIALIASVESLLSAVAVDKLHTGPRADFDREMIGQGAANTVSGLIGGLPITGVIVRSSTNVAAGARTRASAVLHGVWLLVFSVFLVSVVEQIPLAALAGLLIVIGTQLVKLSHVRLAHLTGDLVVYAATLLGVVFLNLLEGVLIGLAIAAVQLIIRVVRIAVHVDEIAGTGRWLVRIDGSATFLSLPRLTASLATVPAGVPVTVEMTVDFLDHAAHEAIEDWMIAHRATGGSVDLVEIGEARMSRAAVERPSRSMGRAVLDDVLGPWQAAQNRAGFGSDAPSASLVAGVANYNRGHSHLLRPHLEEMKSGQDPEAFFLTCADSRIVPNVITCSGPGDLFTVRNVGNLVPGSDDASVDAALAFAVDVLGVRAVVVCGHSSCGAMAGLLSGVSAGSGIDRWLEHGKSSVERFRAGDPVARAANHAGFAEVDQLSMVNVAVQVEKLRAHPAVQRAVAERGLVVSGMFFDLATARVVEVTPHGLSHIDAQADVLDQLRPSGEVAQLPG